VRSWKLNKSRTTMLWLEQNHVIGLLTDLWQGYAMLWLGRSDRRAFHIEKRATVEYRIQKNSWQHARCGPPTLFLPSNHHQQTISRSNTSAERTRFGQATFLRPIPEQSRTSSPYALHARKQQRREPSPWPTRRFSSSASPPTHDSPGDLSRRPRLEPCESPLLSPCAPCPFCRGRPWSG
jgi:hypothetical protein